MSPDAPTTPFGTLIHYVSVASPAIALVAVCLAFLSLIYATLLERRVSRALMGRGGSLEESINTITAELNESVDFRNEVERYLKLVEARLRGAVSGVGVVRFNPFSNDGQGGNQSFSTAFLDEEGRGVVLSTLYARNHVGVYAKPVLNWQSTYELTDEEKLAIEEARRMIVERKKK